MGLDNDSFAMPKGRCSSEISVFNYPEHLNPFYEDDHHKRLRFWKLNFNQNGRRKSFSLTGIKDIWTLKPFTLKKKSSTLGINKTSESPPQFRRNLDNITSTSTNFLNTKARPERTTSNEDFTANKNFYTNGVQQNRFSQSRGLPNVKVVESPFERNSNYRSTLQIGENLAARNQNIKEIYPLSISRGSSVTSSGSTNPFDSEEDLEIKELEIKVVKKKKRKAPTPPVKQNAETSLEQNKKLSNLTAEIVSFVENVKESETKRIIPETVERRQKENASTPNIREYMNSEIIDSNEIGLQDSAVGNRIQKCTPPPNTREKSDSKLIISGTSPLVCKLEDNTSTSNLNEKSDFKKIMPGTSTNVVEKCTFNITISETSTLKLGGNEITPSSNLSELGKVQCIHINSKNINPPPRQIMTSFSTTKSVMNPNKDNLVSNDHNEKLNSSSLSSEKIESTTHESQIANSNEQHSLERSSRIFTPNTANICSIDTKDISCGSLKITESSDNISDPCKTGHNSTLETFTTVNKVYPENHSSLSYPWTKSTLAPLRSSLPPEKRRSVQEIIESINRNQRLLCSSKPINTDNQRRNILDFSVDKHNKNSNTTKENIALTREPSPTTLNLDWNPLPKPKRSKNIYEYSDT